MNPTTLHETTVHFDRCAGASLQREITALVTTSDAYYDQVRRRFGDSRSLTALIERFAR